MKVKFIGDWIEVERIDGFNLSVRKDKVLYFHTGEEPGRTTVVVEGGYTDTFDMPYEEFKANMHVNLNPSYEQRKNEMFGILKK